MGNPFLNHFNERLERLNRALLLALREAPATGYDLMQSLKRPLPPAFLYPQLSYLEDQGLVEQQAENGLKRYALTEAGHAEAARLAETKEEDGIDRFFDALASRMEGGEDPRDAARGPWGEHAGCGDFGGFGGFGFGGHRGFGPHRGFGGRRGGFFGEAFERWGNLSPEKREKLKEILKRTKQDIKDTLAG